MVDTVHIRGDDDPSEDSVYRTRQINVCVVEERGSVQDHLEQEYGNGGRSQGCYDRQLDPHRDEYFYRVETQACGRIKIEVGVMHPVQTPKPRYCVEHHMLKVDCEIKKQHGDYDGNPNRRIDIVEKPPSAILGCLAPTDWATSL